MKLEILSIRDRYDTLLTQTDRFRNDGSHKARAVIVLQEFVISESVLVVILSEANNLATSFVKFWPLGPDTSPSAQHNSKNRSI